MKIRVLIITFVLMIVLAFGSIVSSQEILFEDDFSDGALGNHWWVSSMLALADVIDDQLRVEQGIGDVYIDLDGYTLEGDFTIEVKFNISSDQQEGLGNFGVFFCRPEYYDDWMASEGNYVAFRRYDGALTYWMTLQLGLEKTALPLDDVYDKSHVLLIEVQGDKMHLSINDERITGDEGLEIMGPRSGGLSLTVYNSIVYFDYVKIYQ